MQTNPSLAMPTQTQTRMQAEARAAGRATGAMFFSVFGGVWLAGWARSSGVGAPWFVAIVAIALILFLVARGRRRRYAAALEQERATPERRHAERVFNIVNAGQWIGIFVIAFILGRLGYGNWIVPMAIGVVGLHFFPLARVFRNPSQYVTGAALVLLAISYPQFAAGGPTSPSGFLGAGLILWLSAAWALRPPQA